MQKVENGIYDPGIVDLENRLCYDIYVGRPVRGRFCCLPGGDIFRLVSKNVANRVIFCYDVPY